MAQVIRYANLNLTTGLNTGLSEADAWYTVADINTNGAAGQIVYVKSSSPGPAYGAGQILSVSSTDLLPFVVAGYAAVPGDGGKAFIDMLSSNLTLGGAGAD